MYQIKRGSSTRSINLSSNLTPKDPAFIFYGVDKQAILIFVTHSKESASYNGFKTKLKENSKIENTERKQLIKL